MKRYVLTLMLVAAVLMVGCPLGTKASVGFDVVLDGVSSRSITMSNDTNLVVDDYRLTLYKVELGNSEAQKFTLWENTDGKEFDLADGDVSFSGDPGLGQGYAGTYQFCRVITGSTISLAGSYNGIDGTASVDITGNYNSQTSGLETGQQAFLFGTEEVNKTGQFVLSSAITTVDGSTVQMVFNIDDKVTYSGGISLAAPVLTLEVSGN